VAIFAAVTAATVAWMRTLAPAAASAPLGEGGPVQPDTTPQHRGYPETAEQ
jgi:hypothetical protein